MPAGGAGSTQSEVSCVMEVRQTRRADEAMSLPGGRAARARGMRDEGCRLLVQEAVKARAAPFCVCACGCEHEDHAKAGCDRDESREFHVLASAGVRVAAICKIIQFRCGETLI